MKKLLLSLVLGVTLGQMGFTQTILNVPWYSQKIDECSSYTWCGAASALMVFDYYKQQTKTTQEVKNKLKEYIDNYFKVGYCSGALDFDQIRKLAQEYEQFTDVVTDKVKDYNILREAINNGFPVILNIHFTGVDGGLVNGSTWHWIVLTGIDNENVWINDPGTVYENKGREKKYPI